MAGGGGGARGSDRAGAARSPTTTTAIQSTIQSIKEVVVGHSDADILDTLRESNMDPNETAQKLLNQDPFHEVKRKRDKKKESAGQKSFADSTAQVEQNSQWMKPHTQKMENDQRTPKQGQMSGPTREFRVVRDNRFQHGVVENRPELGHKGSANVQMSDRSTLVQSGRNRSPATTSGDQITHQNAMQNSNSDTTQGKRDAQGTTEKHVKPYLKNPQNEQHFPGSDPAHGSANVRIAGGTVGPAQRHVGVVNSTRQFAARSGSQMHAPSGSYANIQRGSFTSVGASGRYSAFMSRNIQQNQRPDTMFRGRPTVRSFVAQNTNRYHQGSTSNQKVHPIKEWKPKSTKKSPTIDADNSIADATSPSASNCESANTLNVNELPEKISQTNLHEVEHVIIPEHLRVPEYEQTKLRFGSFTSGLDSEQVSASTPQDTEQPEHVQESVQQASEYDSLDAGPDDMDEQARSSQHLSTSTAEISLPPSEDSDRMSGQVENDDGLGLVQSDTPIGAADGDNTQITSTLTAFSAYSHEDPNMHTNNEAQLYGLVEPNVHPQVLASSSQGYPSENPEADNAVQVFRMPESNVHSQVLPSTSEALNPQIVSNSPVSISSQQQQHISQQQAAAQMYPQMHVQHFPNFMPYRQLYSPVYPMPMPNYSPNVPYPSNGNNYLQMPSGGSHLTAGSVKYGVSQFKPLPSGNPSGYGNYTHPAGFTMGSPGVIGATVGVDDVNRMKYKDNIYASTPQVETSDIWIQQAREMPPMQVPSYYNIPGQATPVPRLVPSSATSLYCKSAPHGASTGAIGHWSQCWGWGGSSRPASWSLSATTAWPYELETQLLKKVS
uniref:GBF-interacting protein 1 N-terminal domain-containing protein n=1 Tax=Zea mays TaxID=4577 RepID=A0A804QWK0_MAIZE